MSWGIPVCSGSPTRGRPISEHRRPRNGRLLWLFDPMEWPAVIDREPWIGPPTSITSPGRPPILWIVNPGADRKRH